MDLCNIFGDDLGKTVNVKSKEISWDTHGGHRGRENVVAWPPSEADYPQAQLSRPPRQSDWASQGF